MRFVRPATIASVAVVAFSSLFSLTGCIDSSFGGAVPGYDQQACLERALRRSPDLETVARASEAFKKECREGGPEACSALGVMNEIGVGVPANAVHAVVLYQRACRAGNTRGCTNLGVAQAEGIGSPRDVLAGARLLEPACDSGDPRACFHLARLHDSAEGLWKDPLLVSRLLERACDGDEGPACIALGDIRAKAGQRDGAAEFYDKACSLGEAGACTRLEGAHPRTREEVAARDPR